MFVCLFVYILFLSLSLFVCLLLSVSVRVSRFFRFPSPIPSRFISSRRWAGEEGGIFSGGCENRVYLAISLPSPSRNKASKHPRRGKDEISGFRSGFITYPSPSFSPTVVPRGRRNFLPSRPSPRPFYRVTRPTYRVTKTYIVGKRLDFSQPLSTTTWEEEEASGKRDRVFYTHMRMPAHEYGVSHFQRSPRGYRRRTISKGWNYDRRWRKNDRWLIFGYLVVEFIIRSFVVVPLARLAEDKKIYISVIYY